jgi:hypothetical protein
VSAHEEIWTFTDSVGAATVMADARAAAAASQCTSGSPAYATTTVPGESTSYGVSWVLRQALPPTGGLPASDRHRYMVMKGNKVAYVDLGQFGTDFDDTSRDAGVLKDMLNALS